MDCRVDHWTARLSRSWGRSQGRSCARLLPHETVKKTKPCLIHHLNEVSLITKISPQKICSCCSKTWLFFLRLQTWTELERYLSNWIIQNLFLGRFSLKLIRPLQSQPLAHTLFSIHLQSHGYWSSKQRMLATYATGWVWELTTSGFPRRWMDSNSAWWSAGSNCGLSTSLLSLRLNLCLAWKPR